jgi:bifunctional ADP-heptose synthase (sugar kinase/adenylyltransferase)
LILAEGDLIAAITRDRAAGKRVGFLALSFELLRIGEIRSIQHAAALAERLVVAVVDGDAARVIDVSDRAELVDSVRGVDYVIVCPASGVDALAARLAPDVRA